MPFSKRLNNEITPPAARPFQQVFACSKLHYGTFTTSIKIGSAHQSVIAVPYHRAAIAGVSLIKTIELDICLLSFRRTTGWCQLYSATEIWDGNNRFGSFLSFALLHFFCKSGYPWQQAYSLTPQWNIRLYRNKIMHCYKNIWLNFHKSTQTQNNKTTKNSKALLFFIQMPNSTKTKSTWFCIIKFQKRKKMSVVVSEFQSSFIKSTLILVDRK